VRIEVSDPFDAAGDPALPTVARALDPREAQHQLGRRLPRLAGHDGFARVHAIRVTRHRPGRRCVIEYDLEVERPGAAPESATLIGKVRASRFGLSGYRLLSAFWERGFDSASADGISVPEPIANVAKFKMWLQRKVPGRAATELLPAAGGVELARRIAEAAHKVHCARVPMPARHTMADEVRILREHLPAVARDDPRRARRIDSLLLACERLARTTPPAHGIGIHRDFYADQVTVDRTRLYLLDFDLYCEGDPALDIGNFIGHVTEQSLRTFGRPDALAAREVAAGERFAELAGAGVRPAIATYTLLTLARHVYLSTLFPERRPFTGALLELCEERFADALAGRDEARCA